MERKHWQSYQTPTMICSSQHHEEQNPNKPDKFIARFIVFINFVVAYLMLTPAHHQTYPLL